MAKKREIVKRLQMIDFEGEVEEVLYTLQSLVESYKKQDYLRFHIIYGYGNGDVSDEYYLFGTRLETDKEFEKRLAKEKKERAAKKTKVDKRKKEEEQKEKELYKKLHDKYKDVV